MIHLFTEGHHRPTLSHLVDFGKKTFMVHSVDAILYTLLVWCWGQNQSLSYFVNIFLPISHFVIADGWSPKMIIMRLVVILQVTASIFNLLVSTTGDIKYYISFCLIYSNILYRPVSLKDCVWLWEEWVKWSMWFFKKLATRNLQIDHCFYHLINPCLRPLWFTQSFAISDDTPLFV